MCVHNSERQEGIYLIIVLYYRIRIIVISIILYNKYIYILGCYTVKGPLKASYIGNKAEWTQVRDNRWFNL